MLDNISYLQLMSVDFISLWCPLISSHCNVSWYHLTMISINIISLWCPLISHMKQHIPLSPGSADFRRRKIRHSVSVTQGPLLSISAEDLHFRPKFPQTWKSVLTLHWIYSKYSKFLNSEISLCLCVLCLCFVTKKGARSDHTYLHEWDNLMTEFQL